jgi:tRNA-2-methylthio-N6-dimethylallyladenosine synthase
MNESDSLRMGENLARIGYERTHVAEEADLILLNTCAIRDKAEQKVLSALGRYRLIKISRGSILGVTGCIAQQQKEQFLKKVPYVDFLLGPDKLLHLPQVLKKIEQKQGRIAETGWSEAGEYIFPKTDCSQVQGRVAEFVTVMKGCERFCSYCIVPFVRGKELSRPFGEVLEEVNGLAKVGIREITLVGQNVNSYRGGMPFAELLNEVCQVEGIERVRFTTSNPSDLSDELIEQFAKQKKLMSHFHLPVQSGADRVLRRMRRGYTVQEYLEKVEKLQQARPGIALTSDIIVGFPGETEEDFSATLWLMEQIRFDNVYSFVYSPRPNTFAASQEEKLGNEPGEWSRVAKEVKVERLKRLQKRVREISLEKSQKYLGKRIEVLVEGDSKTNSSKLSGRTSENRVVNFDGSAIPGNIVQVEILSATASALLGKEYYS